jgi:hypothetical protein
MKYESGMMTETEKILIQRCPTQTVLALRYQLDSYFYAQITEPVDLYYSVSDFYGWSHFPSLLVPSISTTSLCELQWLSIDIAKTFFFHSGEESGGGIRS